jgi:hypothetical protein
VLEIRLLDELGAVHYARVWIMRTGVAVVAEVEVEEVAC